MTTDPERTVCAVVVTHNRRELLAECLSALAQGGEFLRKIIVVDNASTDGTDLFLQAETAASDSRMEFLRLEANVGGAGGFHAGIRRAMQTSTAWIWLLDDDTIVRPEALSALFGARDSFPPGQKPSLLVSRALWSDGTMHPMNVPRLKRNDQLESMCLAAERRTLSIRSCSFVSVLVHRSLVERYGLPEGGYFIWNDDVEYTARILRHQFGVMVPASVVLHKTAARMSPTGPRFYYALRNQLWMALHSPAWSSEERVKLVLETLRSILTYLRESHFRGFAWAAVFRGIVSGLFSRPKPHGP